MTLPYDRPWNEPMNEIRYWRPVWLRASFIAASDPAGTAGSQFFVVTGADAGLPPDYAVLGRVLTGLAVVDRIGKLGDPATEKPTKRVAVMHIAIRPR